MVLLAVGVGAAAWFVVHGPPTTAEQRDHATGSSQAGSGTTDSAALANLPGGSAQGSIGSAGAPRTSAARATIVDTVISASAADATVEIAGTGQSGPSPFTARLEKGKAYKARISAHGYATLDLDLKGGDSNLTATLIVKPRVLSIDSDPSGAVILVDSGTTGHTTPFDIELLPMQAQKKSIRVQLRKSGYRPVERTVDLGELTEEDTRMIAKLNEKMPVAPALTRRGSDGGSAGPEFTKAQP